ncbi:hypothetical protein [Paraglaciecola algarum]|nr:hypothetical protein [Paraglaciecola sp. G1-23]
MKSVSIRNGYWFYFEVDGLDIAAHGSAYSGLEIVYINDNPVSEKRNLFSTNGTHVFQHQGKEYKVIFETTSILRGELICKLYIDGKSYAEQTKAYVESSAKGAKTFLKSFLTFVVIGGGVGFLVGYLARIFAG